MPKHANGSVNKQQGMLAIKDKKQDPQESEQPQDGLAQHYP